METDNAVMAKDNHVRASLRGRKRNLGQFFESLKIKSLYMRKTSNKRGPKGGSIGKGYGTQERRDIRRDFN